MRVFAASSIERFQEVNALLEELSEIRDSKPVKTPELHLTFRFFGELEGKNLHKIVEDFRNLQCSIFDIDVIGVGAFPKLSSANVFFLNVQNNEGIRSNWGQIASIQPVDRKAKGFIPHITVSRFRNSQDCRKLADKYEHLKYKKTIGRICLYRSDLGKEGPVYTEIECIQLK